MILNKIIVEGLFSYKTRQELDLTTYNSVLVTGQFDGDDRKSCGSGKSGLFEAVPICFYGRRGSRAKTMNELINRHSKSAYVEVHFEFEGNNYVKIRSWGSKNKNELQIERDGRYECLISGSGADEQLVNLIGLDHISFFSTVFFKQKGELQFIEGESSHRKAILQELFNLKMYDEAQKIANAEFSENRLSVSMKKDKLETYEQIISESDEVEQELQDYTAKIDKAKKKIEVNKGLVANIQIEIDKLKKENTTQSDVLDSIKQKKHQVREFKLELVKQESELKSLLNQNKSLNSDIDHNTFELEKTIKSIEQLNTRVLELESEDNTLIEIDDLKEKLNLLNQKFEMALSKKVKYESTIESLDRDLKKLKSHKGVCPVLKTECSQISDSDNNEHIVNIQSDISNYSNKLSSLIEKFDLLNVKKDKLKIKIDTANQSNSDVRKRLSIIETSRPAIEQMASNLKIIENNIAGSRDLISKNRIKSDELKSSIEAVQEKIEFELKSIEALENNVDDSILKQVNDLTDKLNSIDQEQTKLHTYISTCSERLGIYKNKLTNIEDAKKGLKIVRKELQEEMLKLNAYEKLSKAFGKNGIQKAIMKNAVPMLESMANQLMTVFAPEKQIYIKFDLDPKTKDGKEKAQGGLEIIITEQGQEMNLNLYSGGETTKIAFSILLSLSELLNKRAGKRMETLIIDERISGLDEADITQFSEIVDIIQKRYKRFIVITHISQLKEIFDQNIVVNYSEKNGSEIV